MRMKQAFIGLKVKIYELEMNVGKFLTRNS